MKKKSVQKKKNQVNPKQFWFAIGFSVAMILSFLYWIIDFAVYNLLMVVVIILTFIYMFEQLGKEVKK